MSEVTRILSAIEQGDPHATDQLLPLVYGELRKLAAAKLEREPPGQTLDATGLVHEAYVRLVDVDKVQHWNSRGHFFAAAAEAMRRILVEAARRRQRIKHGRDWQRHELVESASSQGASDDELLAIHESLDKLQQRNAQAATLVKLRYFAGFTIPEVANQLGISPRKADQIWSYARAFLAAELSTEERD